MKQSLLKQLIKYNKIIQSINQMVGWAVELHNLQMHGTYGFFEFLDTYKQTLNLKEGIRFDSKSLCFIGDFTN